MPSSIPQPLHRCLCKRDRCNIRDCEVAHFKPHAPHVLNLLLLIGFIWAVFIWEMTLAFRVKPLTHISHMYLWCCSIFGLGSGTTLSTSSTFFMGCILRKCALKFDRLLKKEPHWEHLNFFKTFLWAVLIWAWISSFRRYVFEQNGHFFYLQKKINE